MERTHILLKHRLLNNTKIAIFCHISQRSTLMDGLMDGYFAQNHPDLLMSNYNHNDELEINFFLGCLVVVFCSKLKNNELLGRYAILVYTTNTPQQ